MIAVQKELPVRKKNRLQGYDYSQNGKYFVTICVKDMHELLGRIVGAISNRPCIELSEIGKAAEIALHKLDETIEIDKYIIMPNHIHMIIRIQNSGRTEFAPTISSIVRFCKSYVTKQIGYSIWQRSYYDRIIRDETEYQKIWQYIDQNPVQWQNDCYYTK